MYTSYLDDSNLDEALRFCYPEYSKRKLDTVTFPQLIADTDSCRLPLKNKHTYNKSTTIIIIKLHDPFPQLHVSTCCSLVLSSGNDGLIPVKGEQVFNTRCRSFVPLLKTSWISTRCNAMVAFNSANSAISQSSLIFLRFKNWRSLCYKK